MGQTFDLSKYETVYPEGGNLRWTGTEGRALYGIACFEHGLQYVMEGRSGEVAHPADLIPLRGAAPFAIGDCIQCKVCGRTLGAPIGGNSRAPIRLQAWMDFVCLAVGWRYSKYLRD